MRRSPGRQFEWLWGAFAVSSFGTSLAFGAFPLIAIVVLHAGPGEVSALAAAGLAVGAAVAVPLGPWVEFRRKRPVMTAMDLARCAAMLSIGVAYALGRLGFGQLLAVTVVSGAADITFRAASGACLKAIVPPGDLLAANARMESTTWTATVLGPPLGGAAIGLFGPVTTVLADAVSYLLSAAGIRAIGGTEPRPARASTARASDLLDGWRHILTHPGLRRLFLTTLTFNGLIMATEPLLAVLMLGRLGFAPWQYGLAFAVPCAGGLVGSRLSRRLVARFGSSRVLLTAGSLRAGWVVWLAFMRPGAAGLILVIAVEFGMIVCIGVSNPVLATYRLEQTPAGLVARTLSAWTVSTKSAIAVTTALWGLLASLIGPRAAIAVAGVLLLATPLLLPRRRTLSDPRDHPAPYPGHEHRPPGGEMPAPQEALSAAIGSWNAGDLNGYLSLYDEGIALHGYSPEPMNKAQARGFYEAIFSAFGPPQLEFHEVLWNGDTCAIRFTMTGTHVGEFMGVPATGTAIALPGITILHFRGDRVVERFSQADMLGLLVQLGAVPAPA